MKQRYKNLRIIHLSSRSYAGYAVIPLSPEPYAYEYGFAVKWLIEAQIAQHRALVAAARRPPLIAWNGHSGGSSVRTR